MSLSKRWTLLAVAAAVGLGVSATRAADASGQPTAQELMEQIKSLQSKVQQLENKPSYNQADVDATVAKVLKDSDRRSLLIDGGGVTSGFDINRGFFISNEDQSFYVHPGVIFQVRHASTYREDGKNGNNDDIQSGFEIHRLKPYLEGNAFTKDLSYRFQWATKTDGSFVLDDAWVSYKFGAFGQGIAQALGGGDLAMRVGQFKNVVFKEETTSDTSQLAADRSLANAVVGGGDGIVGAGGVQGSSARVQGIELIYTGKQTPLHAEVLFYDGDRSVNTDFRDTQSGSPVLTVNPDNSISTTTPNASTNFGVSTRVDYKVFGDWADTKAFSAKGDKADLLDIGGGASFSQGDNVNIVRGTVDAQYNLQSGLSLFGAVYGNYIDFRNLGGNGDRFDWGATAQVGYLLNPNLEIFGRADYVRLDSDFKVGGEDRFWELNAGINYYLGSGGSAGHHAKITVDVGYLPNGAPVNFGDANILSNPNKKDEAYIRGQFQLWL